MIFFDFFFEKAIFHRVGCVKGNNKIFVWPGVPDFMNNRCTSLTLFHSYCLSLDFIFMQVLMK